MRELNMRKQFLLLLALLLTLSGCGDIEWFPSNTNPNSFSFAPQNNVALIKTITSETVTISGNSFSAAISVSNGSYSIDGGPYTNAAGTINSGQTVTVQHTSASTTSTRTDTILTIGNKSATFSSTTKATSISIEPVPSDPTGTILFNADLSSFTELSRTATTVTVEIIIDLTNTSTTDHPVKVGFVALDSANNIIFSGDATGTATAEPPFTSLVTSANVPLADYQKIVPTKWVVNSITLL